MFEHAEFFGGMVTMGMLVCAAFFLRFWLRSKDSLFLAFSLAFLLLSLSHALNAILQIPVEERSLLYLLRLAAYALIVYAILQKNVVRGGPQKRDFESLGDKHPRMSIPLGCVASHEALEGIQGMGLFLPPAI